MTSANFVAWYLQKGGVNYKTANNDQQIVYRTNNWNEANLKFNISDVTDSIRNQISAEDRVSVWIGDPSAGGVKMLDGFVNFKYPIRRKEATVELYLNIIDYIGYLSAKRIFELRYWLLANATAKQIFADASAVVPGITTNIDSNLTQLVKQDFAGTYAKDGYSVAGQVGYADYFGDENLVLQAFSHGGRDLLAPNTQRYKIVDNAPTSGNIIRVNTQYDYQYKKDVTQRFKTVVATSGVAYTFPNDINLFQDTGEVTDIRGLYGRDFSNHYSMGTNEYDKNLSPTPPIPLNFEQLQIGAINYPVVVLNVANSGQNIGILVGQRELQNFTFPALGIPLDGTWQEINFFMRIDNLSPTPTTVEIDLVDSTHSGGGGAYTRFLKNGATTLFISGGMTFFRFLLPTPTSDNGWTKSGNVSNIDQIQFNFGPINGYTAGSSVKFSQLYLYRKVRKQSSVVPGTPATQKIIMDRTLIDETTLQSLANNEFNRVSPVPYEVKATFYGNSDFRKPGYAVDVDFTGNLENDSSGTQLRIDEIIHTLGPKSRWNTEITLKPAYQRL